MLRNYENMYPNGVYLLLQTKCQSFNSYLLEINSEAEQNWLMEESWLFHLFYLSQIVYAWTILCQLKAEHRS